MDVLFHVLLSSLCAVSVTVESELICSQQPIIGLIGDDVILPCHLEPPISVSDETVVWTRPDLKPEYVHYHQDGRLMFERQNRDYYFRTRLFMDGLMKGNVSMQIFDVKLSDAGTYHCSLPSMKKEASIQLIVRESELIGSHEPVIAAVGDDVILPCRLEPPFDVTTQIVEWKHRGTRVHLYHSKKNHVADQDESFRGRTFLFYDEMIRGNISLKLINVTEQDAGNYTCFVPKLNKRGNVTLIINQKDDLDSPESDRRHRVVDLDVIIKALVVVLLLAALLVTLWKCRKRRKLPMSQQSSHQRAWVGWSDEAGKSPTEELTGEVADLKFKLCEEEDTTHQLQMDLQSLPVHNVQGSTSSSLSKRSPDDPESFSSKTRNLPDDQNLKPLDSSNINPPKSDNSPQTLKVAQFQHQHVSESTMSNNRFTPLVNLAEESYFLKPQHAKLICTNTHTQIRQRLHRYKHDSNVIS